MKGNSIMSMSLNLVQHCQKLILTLQLTFDDDFCESLFPKTMELLEEDQYAEAIEICARGKKAERYMSFMDFLICEIFPKSCRLKCFRYYKEKGPKLIDHPQFTDEVISHMDDFMSTYALPTAVACVKEGTAYNWTEFLKTIKVVERVISGNLD